MPGGPNIASAYLYGSIPNCNSGLNIVSRDQVGTLNLTGDPTSQLGTLRRKSGLCAGSWDFAQEVAGSRDFAQESGPLSQDQGPQQRSRLPSSF